MAVFLFLFACGICLFAGRWLGEDEEFLIYTETEPPATEERTEVPEEGAGGGVPDIDREAEEALNKIYNGGEWCVSEQQRKMLATLKRMKLLCAIGVIANVLLHPDIPFIGIRFSMAQTILILIWLYGLINGLGYLNQNIPLFQIGIVRGGQVAYLLLRHFTISLPTTVTLIALDVIWIIYLLSHKAKYYYERV